MPKISPLNLHLSHLDSKIASKFVGDDPPLTRTQKKRYDYNFLTQKWLWPIIVFDVENPENQNPHLRKIFNHLCLYWRIQECGKCAKFFSFQGWRWWKRTRRKNAGWFKGLWPEKYFKYLLSKSCWKWHQCVILELEGISDLVLSDSLLLRTQYF